MRVGRGNIECAEVNCQNIYIKIGDSSVMVIPYRKVPMMGQDIGEIDKIDQTRQFIHIKLKALPPKQHLKTVHLVLDISEFNTCESLACK